MTMALFLHALVSKLFGRDEFIIVTFTVILEDVGLLFWGVF